MKKLFEGGASVWIRIPVIPGANDTEEEMRKIKEFLKPYSPLKIELLCYHKMGEHKYDALQKDIANSQKSIVSSIKNFATGALDSIDEVLKAQQKMSEKLKSYGNLYNKDKYTINGINYEMASLPELSKQNDVLREYADTLLAVEARGDVPKALFSELRDLSVEDGLMFAKDLLSATDEDFDKYIADFNKKQETSDVTSVDCPHSTSPDEGESFPLIRTPNIGKDRLLIDDVHRVLKEVYDDRNKRAVPQANDLILAREAPVGNVTIIKDGQKVCLGQRTVLIRTNP